MLSLSTTVTKPRFYPGQASVNQDEKNQKIAELKSMLSSLGESVVEFSADLATNMVRVYKERGWTSHRHAERNVGISHTKLAQMTAGRRTSPETLLRWARGINEDGSKWLVWGGHDPERYITTAPALTPEQIAADPLALIGRDVSAASLNSVPMIGEGVPAGPSRAGDGDAVYTTSLNPVPVPDGARAMEIVGDCMEPLLHEGDVVFVRPASIARTGDVVIALVDMTGITCKVFRIDPASNLGYLEPYLGAGRYSETGSEPRPGEGRIPFERFSIAGVVVGYYRPMGLGLR